MVQDSIVEKFNTSDVVVAGVDVWNSSDSLIDAFITTTGVTFPVAKKGGSVATSYGVIANSMVVVDQNGVVRFVQQLGTSTVSLAQMKQMVGDAASTVRGLLSSEVVIPTTSARRMCSTATTRPLACSFLGRIVAGYASSVSVVVTPEGRVRVAGRQ